MEKDIDYFLNESNQGENSGLIQYFQSLSYDLCDVNRAKPVFLTVSKVVFSIFIFKAGNSNGVCLIHWDPPRNGEILSVIYDVFWGFAYEFYSISTVYVRNHQKYHSSDCFLAT